MLISIIVPVYNAVETLPKCIKSVLSQSYEELELILIDDGSKDKSLELCRRFAEQDVRIKVIAQENGGVSVARNSGIDASNGEWFTFLDSDDELTPRSIELMQKAIEEEKQVVCCSTQKIDGTFLSEFSNQSFDRTGNLPVGNVLLFGAVCGKLYNSNIVKRHGIRFKNDIAKSEDTIFFWEYMRYIDRISTISEVGYIYNISVNPSSLHNRLIDPRLILQTQVILSREYDELAKMWPIDNLSNIEIKNWLSSFYIDALITSYRMLKPYNERKYIWQQINMIELQRYYKPATNNEHKLCRLLNDMSFQRVNSFLFYKYYLRSFIKKLMKHQ